MEQNQLYRYLCNGNFLVHLLQANQGLLDIPDDLKEIGWEVLPYYLPTSVRRISFRLNTSKGSFLLKLNTGQQKIHREAAACLMLYPFNCTTLTVPKINNVQTNIPLPDNESCAWLLAEWLDGMPTNNLEDEVLSGLLPQGLFHLHTLPVTSEAVEKIYAVPLPEKHTALQILRERRRAYLDQAIKISSPDLVKGFRWLQTKIERHHFTEHIAFIHGDMHIHNIKYQTNARQSEMRLFIFDWEDISVDHPLCDLANFMFSEQFSKRTLICLEKYITLYNQSNSQFGDVNQLDAWLLAAVYFARNFHWKMSTASKIEKEMFRKEAGQTLETIISSIRA